MKRIIVLLTFVLLFGCAASKKVTTPAPAKTASKVTSNSPYDESFDPLSLEDDDIVIEKQVHEPVSPKTPLKNVGTEQNTKSPIPDSLITYHQADGFRVQIFAGRNIEVATMAQAQAKENFTKRGINVYLIFEAPFYKLRIGDFTNRDEAEKLRTLAKRLGYKSAFIARSKVKVPEQ